MALKRSFNSAWPHSSLHACEILFKMSIIQLRWIFKANQLTLRHQWIFVKHRQWHHHGGRQVHPSLGPGGRKPSNDHLKLWRHCWTRGTVEDFQETTGREPNYKAIDSRKNSIFRKRIRTRRRSVAYYLLFNLVIYLLIYLNVLSLNWNLNFISTPTTANCGRQFFLTNILILCILLLLYYCSIKYHVIFLLKYLCVKYAKEKCLSMSYVHLNIIHWLKRLIC